jgi:ubiquinone/menaquinone biosynthesis C-methylase UbiE
MVKNLVLRLLSAVAPGYMNNRYWMKRVKQYGKLSVLNIGHIPDDFDVITEKQKKEIFPFLMQALSGEEKIILDYGCGPGRFTYSLATAISGTAIGIDPIEELLALAPDEPNTKYMKMKNGKIPLGDETIDFVWICLVFGGINDKSITSCLLDVHRVLRKGGGIILIENTSKKPNGEKWFFRSVKEYSEYFNVFNVQHVHDYFDLDERISVFVGKK